LKPGNSSQISGGVTSPCTAERQDFGIKHYQNLSISSNINQLLLNHLTI